MIFVESDNGRTSATIYISDEGDNNFLPVYVISWYNKYMIKSQFHQDINENIINTRQTLGTLN